jgi:Tol biopolymer transport system component/N-acetylneuraminic acid mutarotase
MDNWMAYLGRRGEKGEKREKNKTTAKGWDEVLIRPTSVVATLLLLLLIGVSAAQDTFAPTGSMGTPRGGEQGFTLTRLANGKVLVVGGSGSPASAEVYDPATGTWSPTGSMATSRPGHTATLLNNGKVLVVGGNNGSYLASAELYDPATGNWSPTGSLAVGRFYHTATLLNNGKVLVAAGHNGSPIASVELYDPATGTWSTASAMAVSRYLHKAVLLGDGRVLIAGGTSGSAPSSAELYDPATGTWSNTASMITGRWNAYTLTVLANGKVLAVGGGINWTAIATAQAEIYDPATAAWSATAAMPTTRNGHTATLLVDGRVLVAAGNEHPEDFGTGTNINTAIIYDPVTASWSPTANNLGGIRAHHLAARLLDGRVLVAGGQNGADLATAELFTPAQPDLEISGKIAFSSSRDGNNEIYLMNADGSSPSNLTNHGADDQWGRWSPDGTKILFRSNRNAGSNGNDLYVVNTDGSGLTNLTTGATGDDDRASWSPDGTKIAFDYGSGTAQIYTMNADGSGRTQLTSTGLNSAPVWSPDGSKIAFASNRSGNGEIWVMNADGSNPQNLSNNPAGEWVPSWSPDGSKIAFASQRDGASEIYVMNADGTGQTNLTNSAGWDDEPWWSPDGTKIVWNNAGEVFTMDANGGNKTNITNHAAADGGPTWDTPFRIGTTSLGTPISRVIKVKNRGGALLSVSNITSSDGQFSAVPTSFSVAPGDSQGVTVSFAPISPGTWYTTLTISSNDATSPTAKLTVNGTGRGIAASIPDTVAGYNQQVSVPVRVSDTSGEGVVAGEAHLVFDGDLLTVFSVGTSSTLLSGWSVQSNVVQGVATAMDTLKVAAAHTTALSGVGTLFQVRFRVANVRHPATSPLVLSHLLFNTGSVGTAVDNGSVKVIGNNGIISRDKAQVIPRESVSVQLVDPDEDLDSTGVDDVDVTVTVRDSVDTILETEVLKLFETAAHSGVFTGSMGTVFSLAPNQGDFALQVRAGQHIEFLYDDLLDGSGNGPLNRRVLTQVIGGRDGRLRVTVVVQPGDTLRVRLTDGDLNTNPGTTETTTLSGINVRTGESELLTLTETSASDSVFFGTVRTTLGATAGSNNDGLFRAQKRDTLRFSYSDTLTALGGYASVVEHDYVVQPFGDADDNGQVQAFDAARVLFHVLSPFLAGWDSLSANVDSLAPFGPISPFDASLILQKRVGLIGRFPVQEDEAVNHPQPETNNSTPKRVLTQRVLSLVPGEGYWAVVVDERGGILAGDLLLSGIAGRVELAPALQEYLIASRSGGEGLRVVFAGAQPLSGPGELLRVYPGVGPGSAQLTRAILNDGNLAVVLSSDATTTALPSHFALLGNYPNPFNPTTHLSYQLPGSTLVKLAIYDLLGQQVRVLVEGTQPAGYYQVLWDGRNEQGQPVASGIYIYRLESQGQAVHRRLLLLK